MQLIGYLMKGSMGREAERILDSCNWLSEPLQLEDPDLGVDPVEEVGSDELLAFISAGAEVRPRRQASAPDRGGMILKLGGFGHPAISCVGPKMAALR